MQPFPVISLKPGESVVIDCPTVVTISGWPEPPFDVVAPAGLVVYADPALTVPVKSASGLPRTTGSDPMQVRAVYCDRRALLVFPYPPMWIDGSQCRIVANAGG